MVAEMAEAGFLVFGEDAVGEAVFDGAAPAFGDGGVNAVAVVVGIFGDVEQVEAQLGLAEGGLGGGLGGDGDHFGPAALVGCLALIVDAAEEAGFLAAVSAIAHFAILLSVLLICWGGGGAGRPLWQFSAGSGFRRIRVNTRGVRSRRRCRGIDLDCALRDSGLEFSQHPLWFVGRIVLPFVAVICFGVGYGRWPGEVAGVTV